ncbi:MAG TPA: hypothetical protein VF257_17675 [Solirubrobacteraceae bacterium]
METILVILVCILMVAVELLVALAVVAPQVVVRAVRRPAERLLAVGRRHGGRVQEVR